MDLPSGFVEEMRSLLGPEAEALLESLDTEPVTSVRLNSRKPGADFEGATPVAWCDRGFYLPSRPIFTLDPLLHAGAYYVQDASSMIYEEVARRLLASFAKETDSDTPPPVTLLDMCAAPGGKTTAMIDALPDGSKVVANEFVTKRASILRENLARWGYPNVSVTNGDTSRFANSGMDFDIVAVDAPCSGEGMMRKDQEARRQWTPQLVEQCAALQLEILGNAVKSLKPGGFLIYSTCTFNRRENEENAELLAGRFELEPVDLCFPTEWGIPRGIDTSLPVWRFMPHKTMGEGLFLAVFRKPGEWQPSHIVAKPSAPAATAHRNAPDASPKRKGKTGRGQVDTQMDRPQKKTEAIPPIEEILSVDFDRSRYPEADLSLEQAIAYLRRESIVLPGDAPKGLTVVTYKGLPLGMAKNIGSRANNLYPKNLRILMQGSR